MLNGVREKILPGFAVYERRQYKVFVFTDRIIVKGHFELIRARKNIAVNKLFVPWFRAYAIRSDNIFSRGNHVYVYHIGVELLRDFLFSHINGFFYAAAFKSCFLSFNIDCYVDRVSACGQFYFEYKVVASTVYQGNRRGRIFGIKNIDKTFFSDFLVTVILRMLHHHVHRVHEAFVDDRQDSVCEVYVSCCDVAALVHVVRKPHNFITVSIVHNLREVRSANCIRLVQNTGAISKCAAR